MITVGCSETGFKPVADAFHTASQGKELDSITVYATMDNDVAQYPTWEGYAGFGTRVDSSWKPKSHGAMIPITDVWPKKLHDAQLRTYFAAMAALAHRPGDPHTAVFDHEGDAATALQGGTAAQIDDAISHVADIAYGTPGFAANCLFGTCLTGFKLPEREPAFHPGISVGEFVAIDPYLLPGSPWATWDDIVGPLVDYLGKVDPNMGVYLREFGCDPRPGRSAWLRGIPGAALKARYANLRGISYFNSGINAVVGTDLSALAAAYVSLKSA